MHGEIGGPCLQTPQKQLDKEQVEAFRRNGFVIIDGFLEPSTASTLRKEAVDFARSGGLLQHRFQFSGVCLAKPHIFEADLNDEAMRAALPEHAELLFDESLAQTLAAALPELGVATGPAAKSLKLQHNAGSGGCFPWHYDNAGRPSRRVVSCVVYLNPEWREGDGGELVLSPFLQQEVVVPPIMGRAALFRSDLVLHRVRPAAVERFCFTIWLDSSTVNSDADCNLTARHLSTEPAVIEQLCRSPVQRAVSRAVYAKEYEESLRECLDGAPGSAQVLEEHRAHVASQCAHPQLGPFIQALRAMKPAMAGE